MGKRSNNPNAKRMYQLRLDPTDVNEKAMIDFLDNQSKWQTTVSYLIKQQMAKFGNGDAFMSMTDVEPVEKVDTTSHNAETTSAQSSSNVTAQSVSEQPKPQSSVAPSSVQPTPTAPQSVSGFPAGFGGNASSQNVDPDLKQNNNSFRDLMNM